jgi:ribosome biogenesis GTPase A
MTLADPKAISAYSEKLSKAGTVYFFTDAQHQKGTDALKNYLMNIKSDFRYNRPVNVMVVGIPNVGKSMLINTLAKRAANVTQNRPAVTRANKWIHVSDTFYLLDTPGILTPKFENQEDGVILACIGTVKEVAFDRETLAIRVLEFLQTNYPSLIEKRYSVKLDEDDTSLSIMDKIARKRGFIMRGNQIDYERSAATVIDEFKNGVIGKIAFDFPQSDNEQLRSNELKSD